MLEEKSRNIIGLIGADPPGGVGGASNWNLVIHLVAWRYSGFLVNESELRLEIPVSEEDLDMYCVELEPYRVIEVKVLKVKRSIKILEFIDKDKSDKDLEVISKRLQEPIVVEFRGLGALNYNRRADEYEGEIDCKFLNTKITITIKNGTNFEYAAACVDYLNNLNKNVIDSFCDSCIRYRNDVFGAIGESIKEFSNKRDILQLIYPGTLIISSIEGVHEPILHMELECEWEDEHGLEVIIRKDKVLYVGPYHGEDPFGDFKKKDDWNFA